MLIISLIIIIIIILLSSFKIVTIEIAGVLTEQDFPVVLLICFSINDKFAMTHTKNIQVPVVILIILLQLWSLKSDYQIGEPHK